MDAFPTELLAAVLSYLDRGPAVLRMAGVSRRLRDLVLLPPAADRASSDDPSAAAQAQDFWRCLTMSTFRMDDERFRAWPRVRCWRDMYRILDEWGKREGFYALEQAAPWGMVCLFHLEGGKFVAEALTPSSFAERSRRARGSSDRRSDGLFDREVFFEAEFREGGVLGDGVLGSDGSACRLSFESSSSQTDVPVVSMANHVYGGIGRSIFNTASRPQKDGNIVLLKDSAPLEHPASPGTPRTLWQALNSLSRRIEWMNITALLNHLRRDREMHEDSWSARLDELAANGQIGGFSADDARRLFEMFRAQNSAAEDIAGAGIVSAMWRVLDVDDFRSGLVPQMLNFEYIDGPSQRLSAIRMMESMPVIRPGLYCGSYHPELYGKYCNEMLLVEYKKYKDLRLDETWSQIAAEIFNREQDLGDMLGTIKEAVEEAEVEEAVFVVGRKVTGDCHVPAGKISFGALVHPLLPGSGPDAPRNDTVRSSEDGESLRILRRWHGWGAMAFPIFEEAVTHPGTLVQIENDNEGNHRFGFLWDRSSDVVIVLKWLPIQDKYPWFER